MAIFKVYVIIFLVCIITVFYEVLNIVFYFVLVHTFINFTKIFVTNMDGFYISLYTDKTDKTYLGLPVGGIGIC